MYTIPFFSSFSNVFYNSPFTRMTEEIFQFNGTKFFLETDGMILERPLYHNCWQRVAKSVARLVILSFAALLVFPLAVMVYVKIKNRQIGLITSTRLQMNNEMRRVQAEASKKLSEAAAIQARAKTIIADAEVEAKTIKDAALQDAERTKQKALADALSITTTAIAKTHGILNLPKIDEWYQRPWRASEGIDSLEGLTFEAVTSLAPKMDPKEIIHIEFTDGSSYPVCKSSLKDTQWVLETRFEASSAEIALRRKRAEPESKMAVDQEVEVKTASESDIVFTVISPRIVKYYLQIISGSDRLENMTIDDLILLCVLAEYVIDDKFKRILVECIKAAIVHQSDFQAKILQDYIRGLGTKYPPGLFKYFMWTGVQSIEDAIRAISPSAQRAFAEIVIARHEEFKKSGQIDRSIAMIAHIMFWKGYGIEENEKRAHEIRLEILTEDPEALLKDSRVTSEELFIIGDYICNPSNPHRARIFYEKAARTLAHAKFYLAMYFVGLDGTEKVRLLTEAAHEGHPGAEVEMGLCYQFGNLGFPRNMERALFFYKRATYGRQHVAFYRIGDILGSSTVRENSEVVKYYQQAYELNPKHAVTLRKLGLYWCHFATEKDYQKSFDFFTRAKDLGCTESDFWLGVHHLKGWGTPVDMERAQQLGVNGEPLSLDLRSIFF